MTAPPAPTFDWLAIRARLSPDRIALRDAAHDYAPVTYRQWFERVNQTAHFLHDRLGVRPGDRVAVLARNSVAYLDIWFALGQLGGIMQNLNWRLSRRELTTLVADAAPVAILADATHGETAAELAQAHRLQRVSLDDSDSTAIALGERAASPTTPMPPPPITPEAPWVVCYTGGSTGTPKGAVLSHRAIFANAVNTVLSWGLRPDDVTLLDAPLFHTGGLNVLTAPLVTIGGTSIVASGFAPEQTFDAIEHHGVTLLFGVPTMFIELQRHPRWATADFSRLRFVISGGAPCPMPVFEAFWAKGVAFRTGYGLTEAGPNNFWLPDAEVHAKPGAVGYPLWSVEARLARSDGAPCTADEVGELCLRGPHLFSGYWNNTAATAAALDAEGWLHTGDLATCDGDGCFRIVGRLKDMFISGGENVYPAEVESVLHECPAVAEAAVLGVPDPTWGEVGVAFVVLTGECSDAELTAFCRARLAGYKVPKRFIRLPALPKTGAHKVDKVTLRAQLSKTDTSPGAPQERNQPMPCLATNGINLYVEDTGGPHPPVLCIAGLGYDEWFWTQSVAPYLRDRYRLIMPANRGAGRSDKPAGPYTTAQMAADMLGILDALALDRVIVVGHSLGGFIAQELALAAPERVEKLVLAGTSFGGPQSIPPTPAALAVLMLDRNLDPMELIRRGLETAVAPAFLAAKPPMLEALIAYRLTTPVPPEAFQSQLVAGATHDAADRIVAITCPTLLLAGELDQVVPPGNVELLKARLPHAETVLIPDAGHLFPIEKPQETAAALASFFARPPEGVSA